MGFMSIDPIHGQPIIPSHQVPGEAKLDPKLQKILDELNQLMGPFNHDLGDGKTPGSFAWLMDQKNPTPDQLKQLANKFQDLKADMKKIHDFLNNPENKQLLSTLGQTHGWDGGSGLGSQTTDDIVNSFNNLYNMFNQPNYDSSSCGHADMIAGDMAILKEMITKDKNSG
ncbi:MAG: hypothetical protein SP1CHLAM42_05810 [Chlamydiales bacterium]|nr:hypothetical protein [Chlamydiales bacterium]